MAQKSKSQGSFVETCKLANATDAGATNTATFLVDNALPWEYVVKP
jgi:acid phosphatase